MYYAFWEIQTTGPEATIEGFTFSDSRMHIIGCSPTIRNCVFHENHWYGGGPIHGDGRAGGPPVRPLTACMAAASPAVS